MHVCLHVGEPRDFITHDDPRSRRLELEKQGSASRTYLASTVASQASMLTKMFDIVESIRSVAVGEWHGSCALQTTCNLMYSAWTCVDTFTCLCLTFEQIDDD